MWTAPRTSFTLKLQTNLSARLTLTAIFMVLTRNEDRPPAKSCPSMFTMNSLGSGGLTSIFYVGKSLIAGRSALVPDASSSIKSAGAGDLPASVEAPNRLLKNLDIFPTIATPGRSRNDDTRQ